MPTILADTPLAHALRYLGITQEALAGRLKIGQPQVSRAVRHCRLSFALAQSILNEIDPERELLDEAHLLFARLDPARYGVWRAPGEPREAFVARALAGRAPAPSDANSASS